jgi:hypothetical protein
MLDVKNTELLINIARNGSTPAATRVSACTLLNRLSAMSAKEITAILQETIDDHRTKSGVQVKAMDLIDKINSNTGLEPELNSEDAKSVEQKLMEQFLVCPKQTT